MQENESIMDVWCRRIRVISALGRFGRVVFRPIFGAGCFGLSRKVVSALSHFGPGSFWSNFNRDRGSIG